MPNEYQLKDYNIPQTDWSGLLKVVIIFVDVWLTLGVCILPFVLGFFIGSVLER